MLLYHCSSSPDVVWCIQIYVLKPSHKSTLQSKIIENPIPDSVSAVHNATNPTRDAESEFEAGHEGKIRELVMDNVDSTVCIIAKHVLFHSDFHTLARLAHVIGPVSDISLIVDFRAKAKTIKNRLEAHKKLQTTHLCYTCICRYPFHSSKIADSGWTIQIIGIYHILHLVHLISIPASVSHFGYHTEIER